MKLALGTVQFGVPYGVANSIGQVLESDALSIVNHAKSLGIDTLDTAIEYGESEKCLGSIGVEGWNVITKLPEIPHDCADLSEWVRGSIDGSLDRLNVKKISGLLLHRPSQLLEPDKTDLWPLLQQIKDEGLVEKIGFSIYSPEELPMLWALYVPDLVQAPYSIFDRSLAESGWLAKMSDAGVEVHVRSIFLQGLLLMNKADRPKKFERWGSLWQIWDRWLIDNNVSALEALLSFALSEPRISRVVVGVDSLTQLNEISESSVSHICKFPSNLSSQDKNLINPSKWQSL